MAGKHPRHTAAFKAQVALPALKCDRTSNELASHGGVHPTNIHAWKKPLLAGAESVFSNGAKATSTPGEEAQAERYEQIGRLQLELAWVKKKLSPSAEQLRRLVEDGHPQLSVRRQCALLGLCRSSALSIF